MVVKRPEGCGEAVRVARFLQEFASFLGIVGPGFIDLGIVDAFGCRTRGRNGIAAEGYLGKGCFIDGVIERFAYPYVVEGLDFCVESDITLNDGGRNSHFKIVAASQGLGLFGRNREDELCFARAQHGYTR